MKALSALSALAALAPFSLALSIPQNILLASQQTVAQAQGISLVAAFLGGVLSILSPCILPFLPAFFAYSFKEKGKIALATLAFFAGFTLVFVSFGVLASTIGSSAATIIGNPLAEFQSQFTFIAGLLLVAFGLMTALGMGFSLGGVRGVKPSADMKGAFATGLLFATGWTACLGPVLSAILVVAGVSGQQGYGGLLMFAYSLGIFAPLFLISFFYDSLEIKSHPLLSKQLFSVQIFGTDRPVFLASLLSGIILASLGLLFIFFNGTAVFNTLDLLGTKLLSEELQRTVFANPGQYVPVALAVLALVGAAFLFWLKKQGRTSGKK
ncbi:MAG: cytochrome c biogenesis protein CcdA [Candidatus Micrarchaeia archaeon]